MDEKRGREVKKRESIFFLFPGRLFFNQKGGNDFSWLLLFSPAFVCLCFYGLHVLLWLSHFFLRLSLLLYLSVCPAAFLFCRVIILLNPIWSLSPPGFWLVFVEAENVDSNCNLYYYFRQLTVRMSMVSQTLMGHFQETSGEKFNPYLMNCLLI